MASKFRNGLTCLFFLFIYMVDAFPGPRFQLGDSIQGVVDSMVRTDRKICFAGVISKSPKVYFGATFQTLNHSYEKIHANLTSYHKLSQNIDFIKRFHGIKNFRKFSANGTFYLECGNFLVRNWCLLDMDSIFLDTSMTLKLIYSQNKDPDLNRVWQDTASALFVVGNLDINIVWYLKKRDAEHTRVGVTAWVAPDMNIPGWMYSLIAKIFLPHLLDDLDRVLARDQTTPYPSPL